MVKRRIRMTVVIDRHIPRRASWALPLLAALGWLSPAHAGPTGLTVTFVPLVTTVLQGANDVPLSIDVQNNTGVEIFLNSDSFTLPSGVTVHTDEFVSNSPISLAGGASSGVFELLTIDVSPTATLGPYSGGFTILGGPGANDQTVEAISSISLTIAAVSMPEPMPLGILLTGVIALAAAARRTRRAAPIRR